MAFSIQYYCYACIYLNSKMSTLSSQFEYNSFLLIGLIKSIKKVNIEKVMFESRLSSAQIKLLWLVCGLYVNNGVTRLLVGKW